MKVPSILMLFTLALLLLSATFRGHETQALAQLDQHPANLAARNEVVCEELELEDKFEAEDIPEYETDWATMVREVVILWNQFFEIDEASPNDWRRDNFETYAEYVADAVITYQNQETDIGGRLPRHKNTHLLVATNITIEASVNPDVVGRKGEIGLSQLMPGGPALANLDEDFVRRRPKLNILLGARWLAYQIKVCYPDGIEDAEWTDEKWYGPITVYRAGEKNGISRKTGKCLEFGKSKKRVAKLQLYRTLIDGEMFAREGN